MIIQTIKKRTTTKKKKAIKQQKIPLIRTYKNRILSKQCDKRVTKLNFNQLFHNKYDKTYRIK